MEIQGISPPNATPPPKKKDPKVSLGDDALVNHQCYIHKMSLL